MSDVESVTLNVDGSEASPTPETPEVPTDNRPDGLPENFKTVEALAESYKNTQAELTRLQQGVKKDETKEEVKQQEPTTKEEPSSEETIQQDKAEEVLEQRGLDISTFSEEFAEKGSLSEESYSKLEASGLPKDMVDAYIAGQKALQDQHLSTIYNSTGGEEQFNTLIDWASNNLSENEINAFNVTVQSNSIDQTLLAIEGLKARYESSEGKPPKLQSLQATGYSSNNGDVFNTPEEMSLAARKKDDQGRKLLDVDPKYRDWYFATIANSEY